MGLVRGKNERRSDGEGTEEDHFPESRVAGALVRSSLDNRARWLERYQDGERHTKSWSVTGGEICDPSVCQIQRRGSFRKRRGGRMFPPIKSKVAAAVSERKEGVRKPREAAKMTGLPRI